VHISALEAAGIRSLEPGDSVEYDLRPDARRPERLIVSNLKLV
jgi:cold shock CspA family protein